MSLSLAAANFSETEFSALQENSPVFSFVAAATTSLFPAETVIIPSGISSAWKDVFTCLILSNFWPFISYVEGPSDFRGWVSLSLAPKLEALAVDHCGVAATSRAAAASASPGPRRRLSNRARARSSAGSMYCSSNHKYNCLFAYKSNIFCISHGSHSFAVTARGF